MPHTADCGLLVSDPDLARTTGAVLAASPVSGGELAHVVGLGPGPSDELPVDDQMHSAELWLAVAAAAAAAHYHVPQCSHAVFGRARLCGPDSFVGHALTAAVPGI